MDSVPSFILPPELWLQILEVDSLSPTHLADLWSNIRPVSRVYKAYVEQIFTKKYLPTLCLSLSLPRRDPNTGILLHELAVPDAEVTMQAVHVEGQFFITSTLPRTRRGMSMEDMTQRGLLTKKRLDTATSVWMWFGGAQNRGKGRQVKMPIDVEWDEQDKVWKAKVEWKKLSSSYWQARNGRSKLARQ
ncbi:hypothetical protein DM02DRAFT_615346 [Periconia macrospinosa]|uniref:Uncharacterized protein n=1 Tax=Periconia macrospinosa TaxID=97972 RepID=A0A2V1DMK7_9PLEO|nr:hypothetical protein DM02DRAFT_615346 [Periconia macrospinosa]